MVLDRATIDSRVAIYGTITQASELSTSIQVELSSLMISIKGSCTEQTSELSMSVQLDLSIFSTCHINIAVRR